MPRPHFRIFVKPRILIRIVGILAGIIVTYSLTGFVLIPWVLQSRLPAIVANQLGLHIEIGALYFNPFTVTLRADKLRLLGKDQQPLLDMDALQVNVAGGRSLLDRELHVQEVLLSHPSIYLHRSKTGKFDAFPDLGGSSEQTRVLPFTVDKLAIENADLVFDDASLQPAFQTRWRVHNAGILNLSSRSGTRAEFLLSATGKTGHERLDVKGSAGLTPLTIEGELTLQDLDAVEAARYVTAETPYEIKKAVLNSQIHFTLEQDKHIVRIANASLRELFVERQIPAAYLKSKEIRLDNLGLDSHGADVDLSGLAIRELSVGGQSAGQENKAGAIDFPLIEARGIKLNLDALSLKVEGVTSSGANIPLQLNADGQLSIPGVPWAQQNNNQAATAAAPAKNSWQIAIGSLDLEQYHVVLQDYSVSSKPTYQLPPLRLRLDAFDTRPGAQMQINLGMDAANTVKANLDGKFSFNPLLIADLHFSVGDVPVLPLQAYLDKYAQIDLVSGLLTLAGDIDYYQGDARDSIRFSGEAGISQLLTRDKRYGKDFLGWKALDIKKIVYENQPEQRLSIGEISAIEPYARIVISRDGRLNLKENFGSAGAPAQQSAIATASSPPEKPLQITIGGLKISAGQADFSDFTLQPTSFSADIKELNGTIRSLSSEENTRSDVMLEGRINADEPVKIYGQINPLSLKAYSDLALQFRNINLAPFSPYAGKFAGYRIEEGKLSMDLKYRLVDDQLDASNRFQIDRLALGEKVESPNATDLPLKLVVALLKDADGRIEFELPVSGDLKQPSVSFGGILADAAMKMLTKVLIAPFSAVGGLFSIATEAGAYAATACIPFAYGQSHASDPDTGKLTTFAEILKAHRELNLNIRGTADYALDKQGLAESALMRQLKNTWEIEERSFNRQTSTADNGEISPEEYKRLFVLFYLAKYPNDPIATALRNAPGNEDDFNQARKMALENWRVSQADFQRLAQSRAQRIRNALISRNGLSENRIYLQDNTITQGGNTPPGACLSLDSQ
jgi:hypothetical protein